MRLGTTALLSVCATLTYASDARDERLSEILEATKYPGQPSWAARRVAVDGAVINDRLMFEGCRQVRDNRSSMSVSNLCFAEPLPPRRALARDGWVQLLYPISVAHRPGVRAQNRLYQKLLEEAFEAYPAQSNDRIPFLADSLERNLSHPDFSFNSWEIEYCDGSIVRRPNADDFFYLYVKEDLVEEFIDLVENAINESCNLDVS